jgi:hypothetical protein
MNNARKARFSYLYSPVKKDESEARAMVVRAKKGLLYAKV